MDTAENITEHKTFEHEAEHPTASPTKTSERWILIGGILSLLIATSVQILLDSHLKDHPRTQHALEGATTLFKELGGVLIIGYLVQRYIESRHQENWQRALQKRVDDTLRPAISEVRELNKDLGITLRNKVVINDDKAREELTSKVLRPDFIRRNYKLTLTLNPIEETGLISVTTQTEYLLENVSQESKSWTIRGWIDTARDQWFSGIPRSQFRSLTFGKEKFHEAVVHSRFDLNPKTNSKVVLKEEKDALTLSYPIDEPIRAGEQYYIRLIAEQVMQLRDQFVWNMVHVTDKLDIIVKLEGSLNWDTFIVVPRLMHHQDQFIVPSPKPENGQCVWQLKNILLPYQGVQIWWWPLKGGTAANSQQPTH